MPQTRTRGRREDRQSSWSVPDLQLLRTERHETGEQTAEGSAPGRVSETATAGGTRSVPAGDRGVQKFAPNMPSTTTTEDVPPIMHMVWFGSPTPEHISRVWDTWEKELPRGWRLERWDDERIREDSLLMAVVKSFPELTPRGTVDMLRLWII